jgi:CBS domain containing-hemolysin-like protein
MTIFLLCLCIVASSFFSGSEIALISVSRVRLKHWVEKRLRGASLASEYLEKPYKMLNTILVGNNLVNIGASVLTAKLLLEMIPSTEDNPIVSALLVPALVAPPLLLFGEVMPKALFREFSSKVLPYLSGPLKIAGIVLFPLLWLTNGVSFFLVKFFGQGEDRTRQFFSRRNIELLLRESEKVGLVEQSEREIITGIFTFGETRAREVMTPRTEIIAVPVEAGIKAVVALVRESGFSRIPVYEGDIDKIVGMYHIFDLLKYDEVKGLSRRPVHFVPETKRCDELLYEMRAERKHLAVVIDEYGGTAGIVTLEDLVEELVGDIQDEHDMELAGISVGLGREIIAEGSTEIDDVNEELGVQISSGEVETIGGFIVSKLGRIPEEGEVFRMGNLRIEVLEATRTGIEKLKITLLDSMELDKVETKKPRGTPGPRGSAS